MTGAPIELTEWRAGKRHGVWKQWEDGKLVQEGIYKDGEFVRPVVNTTRADVDISKCETAWIAAYRKELGPGAVLKHDQMEEWRDWCREGKTPG